jgi:hypothetical protein
LGILTGLTGFDALGKGPDFGSFGAAKGEIGHGDCPVMVGGHHNDEALIRIAHYPYLTYSILHSSIAKRARPAHALGQYGGTRPKGNRASCRSGESKKG